MGGEELGHGFFAVVDGFAQRRFSVHAIDGVGFCSAGEEESCGFAVAFGGGGVEGGETKGAGLGVDVLGVLGEEGFEVVEPTQFGGGYGVELGAGVDEDSCDGFVTGFGGYVERGGAVGESLLDLGAVSAEEFGDDIGVAES